MMTVQSGNVFRLSKRRSAIQISHIQPILIEEEEIIYNVDPIVFTNKRVIHIESTFSGARDITSLPYSRIERFSIITEWSNAVDIDFFGIGQYKFEVENNSIAYEISKCIAKSIL